MVDYKVFGGRMIDGILVRPDLRKIFEFASASWLIISPCQGLKELDRSMWSDNSRILVTGGTGYVGGA